MRKKSQPFRYLENADFRYLKNADKYLKYKDGEYSTIIQFLMIKENIKLN